MNPSAVSIAAALGILALAALLALYSIAMRERADRIDKDSQLKIENLARQNDQLRRQLEAYNKTPIVAKMPLLMLAECDCSVADRCPQGRIGMQQRCSIWIKGERLTNNGERAVAG